MCTLLSVDTLNPLRKKKKKNEIKNPQMRVGYFSSEFSRLFLRLATAGSIEEIIRHFKQKLRE